ncbi:MAG: cysteine--tRNA ligase, partial [Raoultibacter sp.]
YPREVVALAHDLAGYPGANETQAVEALLACREQARKNKDWALADKVRDGLAALGLTIEDTPQGPRI